MKLNVLVSATGMAAAIATTSLCTAPARADVVFDWAGTCAFTCSGTATATLSLTDAYSFGNPIAKADFVSLVYSSSDANEDITSINGIDGGLNADGSMTSNILIVDPSFTGSEVSASRSVTTA